jgi:plasmid maintenance system antidote protein VapI
VLRSFRDKDTEAVWCTSQRFWMNLQARYDLEVEKDRLSAALDDIRPPSAAS